MHGIGSFSRHHFQARYRRPRRIGPPLAMMLRELIGLASLIATLIAFVGAGLVGTGSLWG